MRVNGVGNPLARVMFIGEAPGEQEAASGKPFVGKAGAELDFWLDRTCRLTRDDVWITNMCRQRPPNNRDPKPEEIEADLPDLWAEILAIQPDVIVPLGTIASHYFLDMDISLCHALPHLATKDSAWGSWSGTVLPIYHPAAGLHQGNLYALTVLGFEQLAGFLRGEVPHHTLDTTPVDYRECPPTSDAESWDVVAVDTEGSAAAPWCLTYSTAPYTAGLIRVTDRFGLEQFADALQQSPNLTLVMHYAPHDLRVLDALGVHIDCSAVRVVDTMQLAYIAGRLPQGLKPLGYRLCGIRMREYEDLVRDASDRLASDYMEALSIAFGPEKPKDKKHPVYKAVQRCLKSKRGARALWVDQAPEIHAAAAEAMPLLRDATLDDVPFEEVLPYACTDADATRRVFFKLREYFD